MVVCDACGDYSYRTAGNPGWCSVCAEYGRVSQMRWATAEEQCTACQNPHRSDFSHTCGQLETRSLDGIPYGAYDEMTPRASYLGISRKGQEK